MRAPFVIGEEAVAAGQRRLVDLPVAKLSNHTPVTLPVHVLHGRREGPTVFVCAAVHGNEIIGVEIIRRLLKSNALKGLTGTLLCIPIVNAFGFISHNRYLPDGRDLNRSFPGNAHGSLAAQLAHIFMTEVILRSNLGIDLHTGAANRTNLPQLRGDFTKPEMRKLAERFGVPIFLQSSPPQGSLREVAVEANVDMLLYEAGEGLRLDEFSVRAGVKGVLRTMKALKMLPASRVSDGRVKPIFSKSSKWVRAEEGGMLGAYKTIGDSVVAGDLLASVANPYDGNSYDVLSPLDGLIIGRTNISVVNQGDALFHVATVARPEHAERKVGEISEALDDDPSFDQDEVIF